MRHPKLQSKVAQIDPAAASSGRTADTMPGLG
jgi:hypothetical protein